MCFSATASFGAAGLLAFFAALTYVKARSQSLRILALIPAIFALQQATEGALWITAHDTASIVHRLAVYLFLLFAALWPTIMPALLWYIEPNQKRKELLRYAMYAGAAFSVATLVYLITHVVVADVTAGHVAYIFAVEAHSLFTLATRLVYLVLITLPPFLSTLPRMQLFGMGIIASFVATYVWYLAHFTSVWCFFAALLSILTIIIVR